MAEQVTSTKKLHEQNETLRAENDALAESHATLAGRIEAMEKLIEQKRAEDTYAGPEPEMFFDPFDVEVNPLTIKKHPEGKVLEWLNPNFRNNSAVGWNGWVPVTYEDEIGQDITEYINSPPKKMAGTAEQDNYVRRGTDCILCWLPEEYYKARQAKRERKALGQQAAANNHGNVVVQKGVSTYGDGVQVEKAPPGGFKGRSGLEPPETKHPSQRTEMFVEE